MCSPIPDLARRLAADDQGALWRLHAAVLAELEAHGGRTVVGLVDAFDSLPAVKDCRRIQVELELDAVRLTDPSSMWIAAAHLVAVMLACAFDEVGAREVNALRAGASVVACLS